MDEVDDNQVRERDAFAARRLEGRGRGLSYVGGAILIFAGWQISVIPLVLIVSWLGYPDALQMIVNHVNWVDLPQSRDGVALAACAILLMSLVLLLMVTWGVVKVLHGRSLLSVLSAHDRFQWRTALLSFSVYAGAMVLVSGASTVLGLRPESVLVFDLWRWLPFFALVLLLTPFQALAEEAFVRGYLFQGVASVTSSVVLRIAIPAVLFTVMHSANGDFSAGGLWAFLIFLGFGAYFGLLTVRTSGVEAATGAHTANNIFAFSVATSSGSGMPFATIFYETEPSYMGGFFAILVVTGLHYFIFFKLYRPTVPTRPQSAEIPVA
jgi:hypothetical protein